LRSFDKEDRLAKARTQLLQTEDESIKEDFDLASKGPTASFSEDSMRNPDILLGGMQYITRKLCDEDVEETREEGTFHDFMRQFPVVKGKQEYPPIKININLFIRFLFARWRFFHVLGIDSKEEAVPRSCEV
jgi:hypothetical protein